MISRAAVIGSFILVAGCASASSGNPAMEPFTTAGEPSRITIIVQNRNFSEARLYALRRGARESLGIVGGKADAQFHLEWTVSAPFQIEIDMLAGPRCVTEELRADPGDVFELQIETRFRDSPACRRE